MIATKRSMTLLCLMLLAKVCILACYKSSVKENELEAIKKALKASENKTLEDNRTKDLLNEKPPESWEAFLTLQKAPEQTKPQTPTKKGTSFGTFLEVAIDKIPKSVRVVSLQSYMKKLRPSPNQYEDKNFEACLNSTLDDLDWVVSLKLMQGDEN
jgi:hypothetical protein